MEIHKKNLGMHRATIEAHRESIRENLDIYWAKVEAHGGLYGGPWRPWGVMEAHGGVMGAHCGPIWILGHI